MELIIDVLILFIVLGCVLKLSLWRWWQRMAYSLLLGCFSWWSVRYAVLQSKTQIADYLQNTDALQSMAILVTIESALGFAFCLSWLGGKKRGTWYASLLMFPVVFYLLTQTIFALTGIDFETTAYGFALLIAVLIPLLAELVRWLLPDADSRVEIYLLTVIFICLLGLISTESGTMVYSVKESPIDWKSLGLTFAFFAALFVVGIIINRVVWTIRNIKNK